MACLKDADAVAVSMKFPCGAVVTLDVSQHCTTSCEHRLEVRPLPAVATPQPVWAPARVHAGRCAWGPVCLPGAHFPEPAARGSRSVNPRSAFACVTLILPLFT